jgi:hypothetical protein
MKYILLILLFTSCQKSTSTKACFDCTVYKRDGTTYHDRVCETDGSVPQYIDDRGNDLQCSCTKR